MIRTLPLTVSVMASVIVLFGMGATQAAAPAATVEATDDLQFVPKKITVSVGDTVRWKNVSVLVHSVTDVPGKATRPSDAALPKGAESFDSGLMDPGGHYTHRFTKAGTYTYFCIPHEATGMIGTVIVKSKH